jgi:hypothetical protein
MVDDREHDLPLDVPDVAIRSALEFAVLAASVGTKVKPPLPFPPALRPFLKVQRLPGNALARVREAVEADATFRERVGKVATPDLLDEVGVLWLARPDGWRERIADVLRDAAEQPADLAAALRVEQRRREAAEKAAVRSRTELAQANEVALAERQRRADATARATAAEAEITRAARRIAELEASVAKAERRAATAGVRAAEAEAARDAALATLAAHAPEPLLPDLAPVRALLDQAIAAVDAAARPTGGVGRAGKPQRLRRRALPVPGGRQGDAPETAESFLGTAGVEVLVDGYNVAKLGWPGLDLAHQREMAIDAAESIARRWGCEITVVFDGAEVVGASTTARRVVRVTYSPPGVSADDVLRTMVDQLDAATPVVVVTNDQAIVRDVAAAGANVVTSDVFVTLARR